MSFTTEEPYKKYEGDGSDDSFPFPYLFYANTDLRVRKVDALGAFTDMVYDTDFTVAGAGDAAGGTVTYPKTGTKLAAGEFIAIWLEPPPTQPTDIKNKESHFLSPIETRVDQNAQGLQALWLMISRAALLDMTDTSTPPTLAQVISGVASLDLASLEALATLLDAHVLHVNDGADKKVTALVIWNYISSKIATAGLKTDTIIVNIVGAAGGAVVAGELDCFKVMDFSGNIVKSTLLAAQSGSMVVDIWKDTYANFPPDVSDTIVTGTKPTLSGAVKSQITDFTGGGADWDVTFSTGDIYKFKVDSAATITQATLILEVEKTGA